VLDRDGLRIVEIDRVVHVAVAVKLIGPDVPADAINDWIDAQVDERG
jgi:hypothetical protein